MKFKNPVSVVSPVDGEHATNKDYVDNKQVTISWVEYQALSESEKNNGTVYYIPDMPVSASGEAIGEVERLNGYLASNTTVSAGDIIPFIADSNSNMTITNGLVSLKKGKTYSIFCDCLTRFTQSGGNATICIKDTNGNEYGKYGFNIPLTRNEMFGCHASVKYTITPTDDIEIGAYIRAGASIEHVYSDYSKFIITEIPSLQARIDVSDEHIKEAAQEVYSTDEVVIGKWIDGKPIYRKVFSINSINLPEKTWTSTGITISNINKLVNAICTLYPNFSTFKYDGTLLAYSASPSDLASEIIAEYTKTTD